MDSHPSSASPFTSTLFESASTYLHEIRAQASTAIPTVLGLVLYRIPWIISLHFVGSIGAQELAAAALATTLCNVSFVF